MARFLRSVPNSRAHSRLSPPAVVGAGISYGGPGTRLADPASRLDFAKRRRDSSRLSPPTVVGAGIVFRQVQVKLTYSKRGKPRSALRPPIIPPLAPPIIGVRAVRVALRQRQPHPRLNAPVVVGAGVVFKPISTRLAPGRRGVARSRLSAPTVVTASVAFVAPDIRVTFAQPRRTFTAAYLNPPASVFVAPLFAPILVRLAPSRKARVRSALAAPTVIGAATGGPTFGGPGTRLAAPADVASFNQRHRNSSRLEPPTVVTAVVVAITRPTSVTIVRPHRPSSHPRLSAPAVVGAGITFEAINVRFAPARRPASKPRLSSPVVVGVGVTFAPVVVRLAPSRRGKAKSTLRPAIIPSFAPEIRVTLAPQKRIPAHPHLGAPVVIGAGIVFRSISVRLAPSTDIQRRHRTRYLLSAPTVVVPASQVYSGPSVTLTPARRLVAKATLRPPAVVGAGIVYAPVLVKVAPSTDVGRRHRTRYTLEPPTVVVTITQVYYGPNVTTAPARRPVAKSLLHVPSVVGAGITFRGLLVHVAPSTDAARRRRTAHELAPPTVVVPASQVYTGPTVRLTRAKRTAVRSVLHAPATVGAGIVFRPLDVTLAPQKRGVTHRILRPPVVVVSTTPNAPIRVTLTPSRRGRTTSVLRPAIIPGLAPRSRTTLTRLDLRRRRTTGAVRPPVVVRTATELNLAVTLVRITVAPTVARLEPPTVVNPYLPPIVTTLRVTLAILPDEASRPGRRTRWAQGRPAVIASPLTIRLLGPPESGWYTRTISVEIDVDFPGDDWCAGPPQ